MKILTFSAGPWNTENSFGNSYSNIFDGIDDIEFANIYCSYGTVNGKMVKRCFQMTRGDMLNSFIHPTRPTGKEVSVGEGVSEEGTQLKMKHFAQKRRYQIFYLYLELLWKFGKWKTKELKAFIDDYKPDMIFLPLFPPAYLNRMALFIKKYTNVPMIGYVSDDIYTLKQFSLSPVYWIMKFWRRKHIRRTVKNCELLYVISKIQKEEYERCFSIPCKILTKCSAFDDDKKPEFKEPGNVLKMVYAGNVSKGRYQILAEIAKAIKNINGISKKIELHIYTLTPLNEKQISKLDVDGVFLHPAVNYTEIKEIQKNSDILIHAEGFSLVERLSVHQSFSTKIVDYLETYRCIFAIGSDTCASIKYFIDNDCGVVATNKDDIEKQMNWMCNNKHMLKEYAEKGWKSGKLNHKKNIIQDMVMNDIRNAINKF